MIGFYEELMPEEQKAITDCIQLLLKQSFLLEMKYDRKYEKVTYNRQFSICNKYFDFIKEYFSIAGIELRENSQMGIIYIQGQTTLGEKISRLATVYLLVLKILYDEKMAVASNSMNIVTTLSELNEKVGSYGLLHSRPSNTEIRKALALLKRYQIIEPLDVLEDLDLRMKVVIYPSINLVLSGENVRNLIEDMGSVVSVQQEETIDIKDREEIIEELEETNE